MTGNSAERWGSVQIGLHWLIAVLLLVQLLAGWLMTDRQPGELQNFLYTLHKNLGLIVLILAAVRLGWRWSHPVPELPADMPPWQVTAANVTHFLLYLLLFLLPVTGFFYTALGRLPGPVPDDLEPRAAGAGEQAPGPVVQDRPPQPALAALPHPVPAHRGCPAASPGPQGHGAAADDVVAGASGLVGGGSSAHSSDRCAHHTG